MHQQRKHKGDIERDKAGLSQNPSADCKDEAEQNRESHFDTTGAAGFHLSMNASKDSCDRTKAKHDGHDPPEVGLPRLSKLLCHHPDNRIS